MVLVLLVSSVLHFLGLLVLLFCCASHAEYSSSSYESLAESASTTRTPILRVCVCVCGVGVNYCLFPMLIVCKNHRTPNSYSSLVTLRLSLYSSDCLLLASSNCQCELRLCVRVCVCISTNISNCCCCQNFFVLWRFRRVWGTPGGSALCCIVCCLLYALIRPIVGCVMTDTALERFAFIPAEAAGLFVRERYGKCDSAHSLSEGAGNDQSNVAIGVCIWGDLW